mgnify:CR=1 FL=1
MKKLILCTVFFVILEGVTIAALATFNALEKRTIIIVTALIITSRKIVREQAPKN